jgi:hypothetical protein
MTQPLKVGIQIGGGGREPSEIKVMLGSWEEGALKTVIWQKATVEWICILATGKL